MTGINPTHQLVILTRLGEYCRFKGATLYHEKDPWDYMRRKLLDIEPSMAGLKSDLFRVTSRRLLDELRAGTMDSERFSDYRTLYERLVSPGDFADLAIHLTPGQESASQLDSTQRVLAHIKPTNLFIEEKRPESQRSPSWEKLVLEFHRRLGLDRLEEILLRKQRTAKRKAVILRRVRRNVAEYCTVMRIPTDPNETFTPFMLPRVEGLIAANLRFLNKYR